MNTEKLKEAIELRKTIEFEYNRGDKVRGKRIGNPHRLFTNPQTNKLEVHIFQTGGVSDTNLTGKLPWRLFIIEFIENVKTLQDRPSFEVAEGYNPDYFLYKDSIAKV